MPNYITSIADDLSSENLKQIYKSEFQAFDRLIRTLGSDPRSAMEIVGFWNWLESLGFTNTVTKTLSLSQWEFNDLADESLSCVDFLTNVNVLPTELIIGTSLVFLLGPGFSQEFVRSHRDDAVESIEWFVESVCERGFDVDEEDYRVVGQQEQIHEDGEGQRLLAFFTPRGVFSWISCCMPSLNGVSNWL